MLSLVTWFGAQPKPTCNKIQVHSKLGGMFLGASQRPCAANKDAYSVLRKLQDTIATWLCHPKMPPRYLALFVGTLRLTSPDFPFVAHLDVKSSRQVLGALGEALRIDAMWDDGLACAKSRLASKGLRVSVGGHKLSILREVHGVDLQELFPMEVEAYTFRDTIRDVWVRSYAQRIGCRWIQEVDFKRLAQVKTLTNLDIFSTCLTDDVGLMSSLKVLTFEASAVGCIPTTIGLLTRLTDLLLRGGFTETIPSELGQLGELTSLIISDTSVSGIIPSELCRLTKLAKLELPWNDYLEGSLPDEFCNLELLSYFSLHDTPVNTKGFLDGWQYSPLSKSYWTREV